MTQKFASIELARLYEAQGYIKDALAMYGRLDDDVLEGGAEVRAAVKRLELALLKQEGEQDAGEVLAQTPADPGQSIIDSLAVLNGDEQGEAPLEETASQRPRSAGEDKIAGLMEDWLMLMVVRKRLQLFKRIRARV